MKQGAIRYIITLFVQRGLGLLLYLIGSGWVLGKRSIVYFALYFSVTIISCAVMYRVNKETLKERDKRTTDSPKWDKILLLVYWLLAYFGVYLTAGLEAGQTPLNADVSLWIGIVLFLLSSVLTLWAIAVNTYLESTARLQTDRDQKVCISGPYRIIRHPTYAAILLWCVSVMLFFQTVFVSVIAALIAIIIIVRTGLEDRMLRSGLDGYEEYTHQTRYRLFPYIW